MSKRTSDQVMPRRNSCSEKMQKWFDAEQVNWKATGNVVELNRSDSWLQWFYYESHMFTMTHQILYKLRQRSWQRWKPGRSNLALLMVDARCELHACRLKQAEDQLKMSNVAKEDKDWAADGVTFLICFEAWNIFGSFWLHITRHFDTGERSYQSSHLGIQKHLKVKV